MKKTVKVCLLVSGFPPTSLSGTEIATKNLVERLSKRQFEVHVITRNARVKIKGKKRSLKKTEQVNGYYLHRIPCSTVPFFRFLTHVLFGLKKVIQLRPDIIHAQQFTPNGFIAALSGSILRRKTLVWARGSEIYTSSLLYKRSIAQFIVSRATIVLAISNHMKNQMQQTWPKYSFFTLGNGIDLEQYSHEATSKSALELITVGRLIKLKRISDAIEAISRALNDFPSLTLTIIGSGPLKDVLQKQCTNLKIEKHVRMLGTIHPKRIPSYLSKADIFIFPTETEGFPIALLEAISSGLPILASRVTAIPELVRDTINGFLHSAGNIDELTKNLKWLLQNEELRQSMGKESRELAKKFSWDTIINQLIKFYLNMLVKPG